MLVPAHGECQSLSDLLIPDDYHSPRPYTPADYQSNTWRVSAPIPGKDRFQRLESISSRPWRVSVPSFGDDQTSSLTISTLHPLRVCLIPGECQYLSQGTSLEVSVPAPGEC